MDRRDFLARATRSAAAVALASGALRPARARAKDLANGRVTVAVAGVRGRGGSLLSTFASLPDVDVKYVCDVDESVLGEKVASVSQGSHRPEAIKDFRRALDDAAVDALVLGTPDHWHALPTIMACQAGKDVYVEKPDGHNLLEGRTMVAAAKNHGRIVQLGTQSRSGPHMAGAIEYIRAGHLGRALVAKAWESSRQGSIGHPADGQPPPGVDYDLWLGPSQARAFNPARFHGNWRWFFDYGTGDLGNDGVHRLDMARWALETAMAAAGEGPLGFPRSVSAAGGKYYFDDAQEWPDTLQVSFDYPGRVLTYEMRVWTPYPMESESEGAAVYGDKGYIVIGNGRWRAFGPRGEPAAEGSGSYNDAGHAQNFIDCMRSREKPAADLETVGHPSSVLCHLGNAAWRAGRSLRFDAENYRFIGDDDANQYLTRPEYRSPWLLPRLDQV
ncbi:MAG: Gfo/Idh/MocA family oxidoreductase [Pirellulales bacterium]